MRPTSRETDWVILREWLDERLMLGDPPRLIDLYRKATELLGHKLLSIGFIRKKLKDHPVYSVNEHQQSKRKSRTTRPIIATNLGHLHIDLMFLHKYKEFETPKTFRAGTLVGIDVLSRYIYLVPLRKRKDAASLTKAMEELIRKHKRAHDHPILSVSSDKEPAVMSRQFQSVLKANNISFHAFSLSASKAKMAESAIKRIRKTNERILMSRRLNPKLAIGKPRKWWQILGEIEDALNNRLLFIENRSFDYAPRDLTRENVQDFLKDLYKKVSAYYYCQFEISTKLVKFKYKVGDVVRVKLAGITSSAVGDKRSERSVTKNAFEIQKQIAFVNKRHAIGRAYRVTKVKGGGSPEYIFEEKLLTKAPIKQAGDSDHTTASDDSEQDKKDLQKLEFFEEDQPFVIKNKLRSGKL